MRARIVPLRWLTRSSNGCAARALVPLLVRAPALAIEHAATIRHAATIILAVRKRTSQTPGGRLQAQLYLEHPRIRNLQIGCLARSGEQLAAGAHPRERAASAGGRARVTGAPAVAQQVDVQLELLALGGEREHL